MHYEKDGDLLQKFNILVNYLKISLTESLLVNVFLKNLRVFMSLFDPQKVYTYPTHIETIHPN